MGDALKLGELTIDVVRKDIKHVHLSIHPPAGRVRIAAPRRLSEDAIRAFAIGKIRWIRTQQAKLLEQARETPREYLNRETHYVWGQRRLLQVIEVDEPPSVEVRPGKLLLKMRRGSSVERRAAVLEAWYRDQLREALPPLMKRWAKRLDVQPAGVFLQRMRTRWGSCSPSRSTIRLNTELAKKPRECLEYILVHELLHFLEPTHNARFVNHMDRALPGWRERRELLNRLPVRHEHWEY
jgi:predicted metal-dependent hydrolase